MLSLGFLPPPPYGLVVYIFLVLLSVGNADRYLKSGLAFICSSFFFPSSLVSLGSDTNDNQSLLFNVFPSSSFFFLIFCIQQL